MSDTNYAPHIPDAVKRASARADELAREASVANMPEAVGDGNTNDTTGENTGGATGGTSETRFELTPPPENLDAPDPGRSQPPTQTDWEQRYNTLQGKYASEVPELRGQLNALQITLAQMQRPRLAEETFDTRNQQPASQPRLLPPPTRDIPDEDKETYGEELIRASQRWSAAHLAPIIQDLERRVISVEGGNQQLATYTTQRSVDNELTRAVPDWEVINVDPNFVAWLNQPDMFSGQTRKVLIDNAYNSGDAARTVAFFRAYKNEQTVVGQQPGTQTFQTQVAERLPLAELAVPGRGRSVSPPSPGAPEQRIWTGPEISAFYDARRRGRWAGREAEADRIDNDIIAASTSGRIRQS